MSEAPYRLVKSTPRRNKTLDETLQTCGKEFPYMLLDRCRCDCEYYLGNGRAFDGHLWGGEPVKHIATMRKLYDFVKEKPEWITPQDIDNYEKKMTEANEKNMAIERIKQIREETGKSLDEAKTQYLEEQGTTRKAHEQRILGVLKELDDAIQGF